MKIVFGWLIGLILSVSAMQTHAEINEWNLRTLDTQIGLDLDYLGRYLAGELDNSSQTLERVRRATTMVAANELYMSLAGQMGGTEESIKVQFLNLGARMVSTLTQMNALNQDYFKKPECGEQGEGLRCGTPGGMSLEQVAKRIQELQEILKSQGYQN